MTEITIIRDVVIGCTIFHVSVGILRLILILIKD